MFRILEAQAPAKQTATDTINTLSSRLQSATLLEDRRAAILGLRSFAKVYPASVASGALRGLISSLAKDAEDVDTAKVILETLLMLFNPDKSSVRTSPIPCTCSTDGPLARSFGRHRPVVGGRVHASECCYDRTSRDTR